MIQHSDNQQLVQSASLVLPFNQVRAADLPRVGGKGANLGELTAAGLPVPPGFSVTTAAFERFLESVDCMDSLYASLDTLPSDDVERVRQVGQRMRDVLSQSPIPADVAEVVVEAWQALGTEHGFAVRSSATTEDLPGASFAGQHDSVLNVRGETALLDAVHTCWVSLFTDRAILYRLRQGIDHRSARMAVVVQRMVEPDVSGIMFTADPVTGSRARIVINASYGLGEALVTGLVAPDRYEVDKRRQRVVTQEVVDKPLQLRSLPGSGGVERVDVAPTLRAAPALTDAQAIELAALGARIETHYSSPQDIEWALDAGRFLMLQARPITTLYPVPRPAPHDDALHVYFSFSHFQVMTDPLPDLVMSLWRMIFPAGRPPGATENPFMAVAGGRLYLDLSSVLRHRLLGRIVPAALTNLDTLAAQAIKTVTSRPDFRRHGPTLRSRTLLAWQAPLLRRTLVRLFWSRPEGATDVGLRLMDRDLARAEARLAAAPDTTARISIAVALLHEIAPTILRAWIPYFVAGELAHRLLERLLRGVAAPDDLVAAVRGLHGNVVTGMNLAVGDLADIVRQAPELARHLDQPAVDARTLVGTAAALPGGAEFAAAWQRFITRYGMRTPGEIDLRRPRWREDPGSLLRIVLSSVRQNEVGAHRAHYHQLAAEGAGAAQRLVQAAQRGRWGRLRAPLVRRLVRVTRSLLPTRDHHKFWITRLLGLVKPVLLEAGQRLVVAGQIAEVDDVWFLTMPELQAAFGRSPEPLHSLVAERRRAFTHFHDLRPPRVITSEGDVPVVTPTAVNLPPGALIGTSASSGIVEGRARVVRDPLTATLNHGEILVAPFTDPGWTPLFITAAAVVTDVGGVMTHGSVIAREYGIPAVVGVIDATSRIRTGQRIRVNGTAGYVELLPSIISTPDSVE